MKRKICDSCMSKIVKHQIKTSTCNICSKVIVSVITPEDKICIDCSEKHNRCIRCGKKIVK